MDISNHWQDICHAIQEGVFLVDPSGTIVMANEGLARITGYTREELTGRPCQVIDCGGCAEEREKCSDAWCPLLAGRASGPRRCLLTRKDGSRVAVFKNQSLIRDEQGRVVGAVESVLDLTEIDRLDRKVEELSRLLDRPDVFHGLVGRSAPMRRLFDILEKAAQSEAPVLLLGESGTGKELAARALHALGPRAAGPFVGLNCAALSQSLLESELFGHAQGAFTGAVRARQGRFEAAKGGDIFLDEIGDTPLSTQVKLLRVLETGQMERVGEDKPRRADARLITATNRDLNRLIAQGRFREDFYYRIAVIPIVLPPLRERQDDIPLLADHFLHLLAAKTGKPLSGLSPEAMDLFMRHPWPGNVRELRSAMEYAAVLAESGPVLPEHLPASLTRPGTTPAGPMPAGADRAGFSRTGPATELVWPSGLAPDSRAVSPASVCDLEAANPPPGCPPCFFRADGPVAPVGEPAGHDPRPAAHAGEASESARGREPGQKAFAAPTDRPDRGDVLPTPGETAVADADERKHLVDALTRAGGNKALAARLLGVNRLTVYNRMRKYGLRVDAVLKS
ncbi:sigma-54-dependent Fis family transcriptional regulator [Fundidesulfovibrio butyratiphilus]